MTPAESEFGSALVMCVWTHSMGGNPGGDGGTRPPTILKVGDTISNASPPPPHVFVVGRFFVDKIGFLIKKIYLFFFSPPCQNVGVGPTGTPNLSLKNCQRRWRCGKKVSESPPPPPPPLSASDFRP